MSVLNSNRDKPSRSRALPSTALLAASLAVACGGEPGRLRVSIDSDLETPTDLDTVRVEVWDDAGGLMFGESYQVTRNGDPERFALPLSIEVRAPNGDDEAKVVILAHAFAPGSESPTLRRRARTGFIKGETVVLPLFLGQACQDVVCGEGESCEAGVCVPDDIDPGSLADGGVGSPDGGTALVDGGPGDEADAGPRPDATPRVCDERRDEEWSSWRNLQVRLRRDDFTVSGGTVTHRSTGLIWEQATGEGSWANARAYCRERQTATGEDWRLPTAIELASLVDYAGYAPATLEAVFPNVPYERFWTGTQFAGDANEAWFVRFDDGHVDKADKREILHVRCVRTEGTRPVNSPACRYAPSAEHDGIEDTIGRLTWRPAPEPGYHNLPGARAVCSALRPAGWRLPTIHELLSVIERNRGNPAVDRATFPGAEADVVWTDTSYAGPFSRYWSVYMLHGGTLVVNPTLSGKAWCVR